MQREAAAGDDVRQAAVLLQEFVKVQIVVAHDKFNVHIRQLRLDIGGIGFVQAIRPQIHLNGLGVFLHLRPFCHLSAASGQQGYPQHQCHKQGKKGCAVFSSSSNDSPHDPTTACRRPAGCFGLLVCSITTHGKDAAVSLCVHPVLRPNTTTPLERHVHSKMTIQEYSIIITPGFQGILTFFQKHRQTAAPLRPFVFFLFQRFQKIG